MFVSQLKFAASLLTAGNLAGCEMICRNVLDRNPQNSTALNLLGVIAAEIRAADHAAAYFEAALNAEPDNNDIRANLDFLKSASRPREAEYQADRYLVIKGWGCGFWSDVVQVLGSLFLAEVTGRIPVTHWGKASLFGDRSDRDAFELYFKPVSNVALQDLDRAEHATFFPPHWNRTNLAYGHATRSAAAAFHFLNRPETIAVNDFSIAPINVASWIPAQHPMHQKPLEEIYRYLIGKYLRPQPAVHAAADAFFRAHLNGAPFVAVHLRGSDKIYEDRDMRTTHELILSALASIDPAWRIFLLTDSDPLHAEVKAIHGDRVVSTNCRRTSTSTGVHYLPSTDGVQAGLEIMTDTYLAVRANRFIGNGRSNVSAMIAVMKEWQPGDCTLIGRNLLMERNLSLHIKRSDLPLAEIENRPLPG